MGIMRSLTKTALVHWCVDFGFPHHCIKVVLRIKLTSPECVFRFEKYSPVRFQKVECGNLSNNAVTQAQNAVSFI